MSAVAEYIKIDSPVHRLNAITKVFWAAATLVAGLLFDDYRYLLGLLISVFLVAAAARVLNRLTGLFAGLLVFAGILFLIQALFYNQGRVVFYLIPYFNFLPITDLGISSGIAMSARMLTLVLSFLLFIATTRTQDIVSMLVEKLKIPYDYAFMFITSLRFIPTFLGEVRQVSEAQRARGHAIEGRNPIKKIKAFAPVTIPLVLSSLGKAECLAMAMETRGFGAGPRTYLDNPKLSAADYLLIIILTALLLTAIIARLQGYGNVY